MNQLLELAYLYDMFKLKKKKKAIMSTNLMMFHVKKKKLNHESLYK